MRRVVLFVFSERAVWRVGGGGYAARLFFCSLFPVQQTTSGIGHRVKKFFRVGNQYAEYEKQQHIYIYIYIDTHSILDPMVQIELQSRLIVSFVLVLFGVTAWRSTTVCS